MCVCVCVCAYVHACVYLYDLIGVIQGQLDGRDVQVEPWWFLPPQTAVLLGCLSLSHALQRPLALPAGSTAGRVVRDRDTHTATFLERVSCHPVLTLHIKEPKARKKRINICDKRVNATQKSAV